MGKAGDEATGPLPPAGWERHGGGFRDTVMGVYLANGAIENQARVSSLGFDYRLSVPTATPLGQRRLAS